MQADAGAARELRRAVAPVHILRQVMQASLTHELGWERSDADRRGEEAMHHHVRVAADGAGEVSIDGRGEAVVVPVVLRLLAAREVLRWHHAPRADDTEQLVEVGIVRTVGGIERIGEALHAYVAEVWQKCGGSEEEVRRERGGSRCNGWQNGQHNGCYNG